MDLSYQSCSSVRSAAGQVAGGPSYVAKTFTLGITRKYRNHFFQ